MASMVTTMSGAAWIPGCDTALMQTETRTFVGTGLTCSVIGKAFRTAVLLTGGVRQAEAAVLEAIGRVNPERVSDDAFLLTCVRTSIVPSRRFRPAVTDTESASSILAPELKRILLLAPYFRQALVLRVLLGLSEDECERLNVRNASERACAAVKELARIRAAERCAAA